jgi:hypothetical protein
MDNYELHRKIRFYRGQSKKFEQLYKDCSAETACEPTTITLNENFLRLVQPCSEDVGFTLQDQDLNTVPFTLNGTVIQINCEGGGGECDPVHVYFNDNPFDEVSCGEDFFFYVTDQNDNLVTPLSVSGNTIQVNIPECCEQTSVSFNDEEPINLDCDDTNFTITDEDETLLAILSVIDGVIRVNANCPTLCEQIGESNWTTIKDCMTEAQIEDAEEDLCDCPPPTPSGVLGLMPTQTGQNQSFDTGDDGWNQAGRGEDFFFLGDDAFGTPRFNPYGNQIRFTGYNGGYREFGDSGDYFDIDGNVITVAAAFPDFINIDWETYNGVKVLGWYMGAIDGNASWEVSKNQISAFNVAGYTGFRMANKNEWVMILRNSGNGAISNFAYMRRSATPTASIWTSNRGSSQAVVVNTSGELVRLGVTGAARRVAVREFTVVIDPVTGGVTLS